jgi:hypothetical protein
MNTTLFGSYHDTFKIRGGTPQPLRREEAARLITNENIAAQRLQQVFAIGEASL